MKSRKIKIISAIFVLFLLLMAINIQAKVYTGVQSAPPVINEHGLLEVRFTDGTVLIFDHWTHKQLLLLIDAWINGDRVTIHRSLNENREWVMDSVKNEIMGWYEDIDGTGTLPPQIPIPWPLIDISISPNIYPLSYDSTGVNYYLHQYCKNMYSDLDDSFELNQNQLNSLEQNNHNI